MFPESRSGNTSTFACPATSLSGALRRATRDRAPRPPGARRRTSVGPPRPRPLRSPRAPCRCAGVGAPAGREREEGDVRLLPREPLEIVGGEASRSRRAAPASGSGTTPQSANTSGAPARPFRRAPHEEERGHRAHARRRARSARARRAAPRRWCATAPATKQSAAPDAHPRRRLEERIARESLGGSRPTSRSPRALGRGGRDRARRRRRRSSVTPSRETDARAAVARAVAGSATSAPRRCRSRQAARRRRRCARRSPSAKTSRARRFARRAADPVEDLAHRLRRRSAPAAPASRTERRLRGRRLRGYRRRTLAPPGPQTRGSRSRCLSRRSTSAGTSPRHRAAEPRDLLHQRRVQVGVALARHQERHFERGRQPAVHERHLELELEVAHRAQTADHHQRAGALRADRPPDPRSRHDLDPPHRP